MPLDDNDIERIGRGLDDRSLPKPDWTHAAHFAAALWWLRRCGDDAFRAVPGMIRAYNEATGTPNTDSSGYHETITLASLRAAKAWLHAHEDESLSRALAGLLATECGRSDWLLRYWSQAALFSVTARRTWAAPDRHPFPY